MMMNIGTRVRTPAFGIKGRYIGKSKKGYKTRAVVTTKGKKKAITIISREKPKPY